LRLRALLQSEASECGIVSLTMLANFYGLPCDVGDLRRAIGGARKGMSLGALIDAARLLKLNGRPLTLSLDELNQLNCPCILHWD